MANAQQMAQSISGLDLSILDQGQNRLDALVESRERMNVFLSMKIGEIMDVAQEVSESIQKAVRTLQFEDISMQMMDHVHNDLVRLRGMMHEIDNLRDELAHAPHSMENIRSRVHEIRDCWVSVKRNFEKQEARTGDIELF